MWSRTVAQLPNSSGDKVLAERFSIQFIETDQTAESDEYAT